MAKTYQLPLAFHPQIRDMSEFLLVTLTQSVGAKEGIPSASGMVKLGGVGTLRARNPAGVPQPLEMRIC